MNQLSTHPLLTLLDAHKNRLKSLLTDYIDATVDSQFASLRNSIETMIQSGVIGPNSDGTHFDMKLPQPTHTNTHQSMDEWLDEYLNDTLTRAQRHHNNLQNEVSQASPINTDNHLQMIKQEFDDDDEEEMDDEDEDGEEIDDDNVEKCENCEKGICNSVRQNYDDTCGDDTETRENGDEHFETQLNVALQTNNQTTQSIISNGILPNQNNPINTKQLIKQESLQVSSITSIPLDFTNIRNAALNDISIDEQIEGQNTKQIQTDDFDDNDEDTEIDSDHDEEKSSSRPVENPPPIAVTLQQQPNQSRVTRQSTRLTKRKITEKEEEKQLTNEVDNRDNQQDTEEDDDDEQEKVPAKRTRPSSGTKQKQIITHTLQCPQLNCPDVFVQDSKLLTAHLWDRHSIRKNQCLVKDCAQSFDKKTALGHHRSQTHKFTSQWHCDKCDHHFPSYSRLSTHNREYHQLGHFQCSACTFTGNCRKKVINHYAQQHKRQLQCSSPGCQFRTWNLVHFKRHQRTHSGIKPYRCKWYQCDFESAGMAYAIDHIRRKHLTPNPSATANGAQLGEPSDYLEVMHDLL